MYKACMPICHQHRLCYLYLLDFGDLALYIGPLAYAIQLQLLVSSYNVNEKVHNNTLNPCLKHSHSIQMGCQSVSKIFTVSVALIRHLLAPLYCVYYSLQDDIQKSSFSSTFQTNQHLIITILGASDTQIILRSVLE